jgi:hypothetical protein
MKGPKRTGSSGVTGATKAIQPSKSVAPPKMSTNLISRLGAYAHPPKRGGKKAT